MALQDKYKTLIDAATAAGVTNLQVSEVNNVLHIDGSAPTGAAKDQLWAMYDTIDPDYKSGDLLLNVTVAISDAAGAKLKVNTQSSSLNVRKGPGTDQPIVGSAAHDEEVTLVSKTNEQWWLIRTAANDEGYSYAQYLIPV